MNFSFRISTAVNVAIISILLHAGCVRHTPKTAPQPSWHSLQRLLEETVADLRTAYGKDSIPSMQPFLRELDREAATLRPRFRDIPPEQAADSLISIIYDGWELTFDSDRDELAGVLPHTAIHRASGTCMGVSLLFLLLGEKLSLPVHGVVLPGHFYVRYDDESVERNIEPNLTGHEHPRSYYHSRYELEGRPWYDQRSLSPRESAGVFCYNIANILHRDRKNDLALRYYQKAVFLFPDYGEAWGNGAIVWNEAGEPDSARSWFSRAWDLHPQLEGLAVNRGAFELHRGKHDAALRAYRAGLAYAPEDPHLWYGVALAHLGSGNVDSARQALGFLQQRHPDSEMTAKLAYLIAQQAKR
jgi:tetratricopeptide (TPR) repeat protein